MQIRSTNSNVVVRLLLITLAALLVFAIGRAAGWIQKRASVAAAQQDFVRLVESLDGIVYYDFQQDPDNPDQLLDRDDPKAKLGWLGHFFGIDFAHDIFYVQLASFKTDRAQGRIRPLYKEQVSDELMQKAASLSGLRWLSLSGTRVTDQGISTICKSLEVERIWLSETRITDQSLAEIAKCPSVTHLAIEATPTSDAGLERISTLPNLRVLSIGSPLITPAGLSKLARLAQLEELHADLLPVGDQTLEAWSSLSNLKLLSIRKSRVTDVGVGRIQQFSKLRELHLDGLRLTDAAFRDGFELPELTTLTIEQTRIGDQGLSGLAKCRKLESLKASGSACTLTGLCRFFTENLDRSLSEALAAVVTTRENDQGEVISLDTGRLALTDDDIDLLGNLDKLQWLTASNSRLSDAGARALSELELPDLKIVNLNYSPVGDAGLASLVEIPSLTNLHVAGTKVSSEGIATARAARPGLSIYDSDFQATQRMVRSLNDQ